MNATDFLKLAGDNHGGKIKTACGLLCVVGLSEIGLKQLSAIILEAVSQANKPESKEKSVGFYKITERRRKWIS